MTSATRPVAGASILAGVGVVVVVVTAQSAGIVTPPPEAFSAFDPGPVTRWGRPGVRFVGTGAAVLCVGTLLAALVLRRRERPAQQLRRWAMWLAVLAAVTQSVQVLLSISAAAGRPVLDVPASEFVACLGLSSIVYCLVGVAGMSSVAVAAGTRLAGDRVLLLALAATAVPFMGGHSGSDPDHVVSQALIVVHVLAATVWVGGLGALLILGAALRDRASVRAMVPVFSRLALWCAAATVLSGIASAVVRQPETGYSAGYLTLLAAKLALFAVLCGFGLVHRRDDLTAAGPTFARRAYAELGVMVAVVSVATVLSQLSPEQVA